MFSAPESQSTLRFATTVISRLFNKINLLLNHRFSSKFSPSCVLVFARRPQNAARTVLNFDGMRSTNITLGVIAKLGSKCMYFRAQAAPDTNSWTSEHRWNLAPRQVWCNSTVETYSRNVWISVLLLSFKTGLQICESSQIRIIVKRSELEAELQVSGQFSKFWKRFSIASLCPDKIFYVSKFFAKNLLGNLIFSGTSGIFFHYFENHNLWFFHENLYFNCQKSLAVQNKTHQSIHKEMVKMTDNI